MSIKDIFDKTKSGVCKIEFYNVSRELINSGSGFIYLGNLVTNSHVFHPEGTIFPDETPIKLIFGDSSYLDFLLRDFRLLSGSDENNGDYAVYNIDGIENKFNFEISSLENVNVGDEVLVLGFPFDAKYLVTHHGRVSALFNENSINKIQIDASVNQGNSGGPLYHITSGKVIGIVTRKQTGLVKDFDDLLKSFSNNITILQNAQKNGSVMMMGINPINFFEITQRQMQLVSKSIKRSANTGIGYAFSCEGLINKKT